MKNNITDDFQVGKTVKGVHCDARNCIYNNTGNLMCTASKISVGTQNATSPDQTICATFKLK